MFRKDKLLKLLECLYLIIIIISVSLFYLTQSGANLFFNADTLLIGDFFKNIFYENGSVRDWIFPSTFCIFPDWLIFFVASLFSKKIYFQFLIVACLNVLLLYWIVKLIYREFFSKEEALLFTFSTIGIFILLATNLFEPYLMLLTICYHAGAFIVGLFYIYIQIKYIKKIIIKKGINILIFLAIGISLIMGISDPIFLAEFSMPVFLTTFLLFIIKKISLKDMFVMAFVPLIFVMLGVGIINQLPVRTMLFAYLDHPSLTQISLETIQSNVSYLKECFKLLLNSSYSILIVFGVFYISNFSFMFFFKKLKFNKSEIFFILFIIISVLVNITCYLITKRPPNNRYLMTFYFYPVLLFFVILLGYKKIINITKIFYMVAYLALFFLIYKIASICLKGKINLKKEFYPQEIRCVDNLLKNHAHEGIANYWDSRIYTYFSQIGLKVDAVGTNLTPFNPIGNTKRFKNTYSFIITDVFPGPEIKRYWMPNDKLIKLYQPILIKICGGKKVIFFKKNHLKISFFQRSGDEFTWLADMLPSRFPSTSIQQNGSRVARHNETFGFLVYGPYVNLPKGTYHLLINYISDAPLNVPTGYWDVAGIKSGQLKTGVILGTNKKNEVLETKFTINETQENELYETRVYVYSVSQFVINTIKLIKE